MDSPTTFRSLLERVATEGPRHVARVEAALAPLSDEAFRRPPAPGVWSCGQVVEHLILGNSRYLVAATDAVERAAAADPETPVRLSWIGRFLVDAAGPEVNAPAPPPMRPGPAESTPRRVIDDWKAQQEAFARLVERAQGRDLNRFLYRNPYVPVFRMNLADVFTLAVEHTERHVRQIEERAPR